MMGIDQNTKKNWWLSKID